ncbi:MAG: sigma-54-dependent Fis family transcriptional regulator [Betaproteobacteria bacterium]|nr:sigma-54-dependent Fis family transcriptional regulator [Betaproteobacteria bacterium]MBI2961244.1 sigma-54-dependent Fis family transcriptional regulator [Betaproteobacteria bacterium]
MAQILVIDDEIGIRELLSEILSDEGHTVQLAENATTAREFRGRARPDLVLLDIWMPDTDGITLLKDWSANGLLTMPVIMMSGHGTIETAVEATRIGATDFLEKPIALQKLLATVKRALRSEERRPATALSLAALGRSALLGDLRRRLAQVAGVAVPVLFRGERGLMPELYARALHQANTPWLAAAQALADGAQDLLALAAGGVLFVEELAALSREQQRQLAAFAAKAERSKVRLVSFTAEEPRKLIQTHGYEPDLLARLSELTIGLPALREHAEDIPDIANLMLAQLVETRYCPPRQFATSALNVLRNFSWPGNLEDLASAVRSLALTSLEETIAAADVERVLPQYAARATELTLPLEVPLREAREAFERAYFEHHLALEGGSIARVAEKCGLERTHLYRKLKQLGIAPGRREE